MAFARRCHLLLSSEMLEFWVKPTMLVILSYCKIIDASFFSSFPWLLDPLDLRKAELATIHDDRVTCENVNHDIVSPH